MIEISDTEDEFFCPLVRKECRKVERCMARYNGACLIRAYLITKICEASVDTTPDEDLTPWDEDT